MVGLRQARRALRNTWCTELLNSFLDWGSTKMEEIELLYEESGFPAVELRFDPMTPPYTIGNTLESAAEQAMRPLCGVSSPGCSGRRPLVCGTLTVRFDARIRYILFQLWLYPPENGKWRLTQPAADDKAVGRSWIVTCRRLLQLYF